MPEGSRGSSPVMPRDGLSPRANPPSASSELDAGALASRARLMQEQRASPSPRSRTRQQEGSPPDVRAALLEESHGLSERQVVAVLDADGNGSVDASELRAGIAAGVFALGSAETAADDARQIMETFDANGDGILSPSELDHLAQMVAIERARDSESPESRRVSGGGAASPARSNAFSVHVREPPPQRYAELEERQRMIAERSRSARNELSELNDQIELVAEAIAGPLDMPSRRHQTDGRSLQAAAQALNEELTHGSAWTAPVPNPSSWGEDGSPRQRPKARLSRAQQPSKAILSRMQTLQRQRSSPTRSPRRAGSSPGWGGAAPRRGLVLPEDSERPEDVRYGHVSVHAALTGGSPGEGGRAMAWRPQSPQRTASANAVAAAASPVLQQMLAAASPAVSRIGGGSPGRARRFAGTSPSPRRAAGSPSRTSPLAAVRTVSTSRSGAQEFVSQLRSLSPGRDPRAERIGPAAAAASPRMRRLDIDGEGGREATGTPLTKRQSSSEFLRTLRESSPARGTAERSNPQRSAGADAAAAPASTRASPGRQQGQTNAERSAALLYVRETRR